MGAIKTREMEKITKKSNENQDKQNQKDSEKMLKNVEEFFDILNALENKMRAHIELRLSKKYSSLTEKQMDTKKDEIVEKYYKTGKGIKLIKLTSKILSSGELLKTKIDVDEEIKKFDIWLQENINKL